MELIVETKQGSLKGKVTNCLSGVQFLTFKGIPYAKPPVGDLRFSVPAPPEPWEGIRDATIDCNICPQFDKETANVVGDEDCLYLNVYTPKLPATDQALLPVMMFLHGGGFIFGHGTDDSAHGPDYLIEKDVVVVSINYRLGILGFLCLDLKEAPGNMGLRDQVQALKWIQNNISNFGGDPKNVTIFGFSAGAASVEYLTLSPTAKGLFHKAIAQSGSSLLPWALNHNVKQLAYNVPAIKSKIIKDDLNLLQHLKDLPIKELISASMQVIASDTWRGGINFGFVPTVEKPGDWEPFLDEKPYDLIKKGKFTKVPYISGVCSREGLLMVSHGAARLEKLKSDKKLIDLLPFDIDDVAKADIETQLKKTYLEAANHYNEEDSFAIDFFSDVDFFGGCYVSTLFIAKNNSPVYFFEFAYDGAFNYLKKKYKINREGACHGDDGGYIVKAEVLLKEPCSEQDLKVRNQILIMWTNFAKYGDPTPKIGDSITTKWEPIAESGLVYLHIDKQLTMKNETELYPERAKLFKELYEKYEKK